MTLDQARLISIRRDLHRIPEGGFEEFKTQSYLKKTIASFAGSHLEMKEWRTGLFVMVKGHSPEKTFGYRADIDGLPITEETGYPFASEHEGYMHACGHDFHMTIALGVLARVSASRPKDNILFIFQPAEEGPGGAQPMLESDEFKQWKPDEMLALHIAPEYPVGTVATKPGLLFANTSELFIDLKGRGGHAALPHLANDMVVACSQLVTQFQTIVARNVAPLDSAVVTVGKITGGTKQNIIAEHARLEGTIRTLSIESMRTVKDRIEALTAGIETGYNCTANIDYGANYCQVYNNPAIAERFMQFAAGRNGVNLVECEKAMTGEDFGYFLEEVPGLMFWLGVASESGLHTPGLNPDEGAIPVAVDFISEYLSSVSS
ncbi:N-acetyldiaminopimelate deacetylase [Alteribacter natronophilus]|uniref:N-acetyldiaminopimelate deacetylase n=1 Tax=Alteribacter natronophilus TaxID=2583810 RepID=UPI00110DFBAC|nr:N-acetyldiaminopimelate deacetylase [Alteribacter natronophilus]TMW73014.1 N-acetyldiaminopimelate deacetylase [Alteribacter natronophilus]